ncbi:hypothetical protein GCM10023116_01680 [Kistimonas scapharcae]|uniref:Lipoprotein n=1 Tax=Kistimonas scapharcae TaxID=1036133 RepID=A0ABP8UVI7_9GAMM
MKGMLLAVSLVVLSGCAAKKQCVDMRVVMWEGKANIQQMCFEPLRTSE